MSDKGFYITQLLVILASFFYYLGSGNSGSLVFALGVTCVLVSTVLINSNRKIYYAFLLSVVIIQSIILINTYLFKLTYLHDIKQYLIFVAGVTFYIIPIALILKPDILKAHLKLPVNH